MPTIRIPHHPQLLLAQEVRLLDMFDGALPPDPPEPPMPAAHDFLVMCLRPEDPPAGSEAIARFRSAA